MLKKIYNSKGPFKKNFLMYYLIICCMLLTHLYYIIYFNSIGSTFMSILNIFSVIFYIVLFFLFITYGNPAILNLAFYEVCIHAFFASLAIGYGNGFELFIICSLFASFNLIYMTKSSKLQALLMISFAFSLLFGIRFIPDSIDLSFIRIYPMQSSLVFIFTFNTIIAFAMVGIMLIVFYSYIRSDKERLAQQNYQLTELAYMDSLTQILNRRAMKLRLEAALEVKKTSEHDFVIAIADLDDFKQINDNFGHDCGDMVLKKVVKIIKDNVRSTDHVARWGGDEILILFNKSTLDGAMTCIERIHNDVSGTVIDYNDKRIAVTMTIGACQSKGYHMYQDVIREADRRLYTGKQKGKNCIVFTKTLHDIIEY